TVTGGSGTPNVDIQVTYNNKTETASVKNGEFELANAGIYNISYVATDFIGKKCERNFAIKANISKAPVIGDVVLPTVYKQGSLMVLNLPTAYDYHSFSGLGKEVPVKIYAASYASGTEITDDDYKEVKLKNGRYEFTPSKTADRVKIRYEATTLIDNNTEKKYSDEIVLVKSKTSDNKNIDIINYWYYNADDVEILNETVSSNKSEQSFKIKNEGTELKYVIPTEANSFSLGLSTSKSSARFEKITINLRDSVNINQVLSLVVTAKDKNNLLISTMQGDEGVVAGKIANAIEESLVTLRYKDGQILDEKLNVLFGVTKYDNGDEFNGFDSNKVYVSVTFNEMLDDAKEPSVVKFKNFYSVTKYEEGKKDASSPTIKLDGHISQYSYYLDTVVIPTAKAYDLCSPYCDVTVSVTDPDGEFVIGNASADKEYSFTFTKYGTYVVTYTSKNELNKSRNSITNINVLDKDAPVIEINGQIKTNYKVGEVLTLPTYSVTDNVCETKDIYKYIYLETPTFGYKTIACGNDVGTYIFQAPGKYTLVYFAMDNTSNFAYKTFDITVTV
ncbi:MAG: hypothetical protein J6R88_03110, partial [Clostridia bacterium]|nr:hypothetical protein [Clostridia bacterium]